MKKAIAMKCTQEQWDSIKGRVPEGIKIFLLGKFKKKTYIVLFEDKSITNAPTFDRSSTDEIHETFNAKIFLDACGIKTDVYEITKKQLEMIEADGCTYVREWFPECFKKELIVGKWYKKQTNMCDWLMNYQGNTNISYGFNSLKKYSNEYLMEDANGWKEATSQEVETALICEAKKRGFEEGVQFNSCVSDYVGTCNGDFRYDLRSNKVFSNGTCVFSNGEFATIIQPEKMTLEQIEKELGRKIQIVWKD